MTITLNAVYADLPDPLQRAYRHLALLPGPMFSAAAAAAALAADDTAIDSFLARLSDVNLVQFGPELDQWRMPEPAAAHARALSEVGDSAGERAAVLARAVHHYLMWAARLDTVIAPGRRRYAAVFAWHPELPPAAADDQAAITMMQPWVPVLLAAQAAAADAGLHALAWQFAEALWGYVLRRQDYAAGQQVCATALDSAYRCADLVAQARAHMLAGALARRQGHLPEAMDHHDQAGELFERSGDTLGSAAAAEHLGATLLALSQPSEAVTVLQSGLDLYRAAPPHPRGQALLRRQLAIALARLGHHTQAYTHFDAAEGVFTDLGEPYLIARLALDLAEAAIARSDLDQALEHLGKAARVLPDRSSADDAHLHYLYAKVHRQAGHTDAADRALTIALDYRGHLPDDHPTALLVDTMASGSRRTAASPAPSTTPAPEPGPDDRPTTS
ncbi:hypothetical protein ACFOY4_01040 [Actinomadura syzygii]|uniref:Uncharacterized protein n=1 Tax=Actinomadura syzygii TaxID=1427538 RepID=A0A5D0TR86_9ACTN|nr:hypothetical protein [Actinomadura syzygii]TYC08658.1 hypothetical protein FXF65_37870 [Actinomadura syzygii]